MRHTQASCAVEWTPRESWKPQGVSNIVVKVSKSVGKRAWWKWSLVTKIFFQVVWRCQKLTVEGFACSQCARKGGMWQWSINEGKCTCQFEIFEVSFASATLMPAFTKIPKVNSLFFVFTFFSVYTVFGMNRRIYLGLKLEMEFTPQKDALRRTEKLWDFMGWHNHKRIEIFLYPNYGCQKVERPTRTSSKFNLGNSKFKSTHQILIQTRKKLKSGVSWRQGNKSLAITLKNLFHASRRSFSQQFKFQFNSEKLKFQSYTQKKFKLQFKSQFILTLS